MANNISSISDFVRSVAGARRESLGSLPGIKVSDDSAFGAMQSHVVSLYRGIEATHSFEDENGSIFDCIPVSQQPALRGAAPAQPPSMPRTDGSISSQSGLPVPSSGAPLQIPAMLGIGNKDRFGNDRLCPAGFIPMRRITLEELARFGTLQQYFEKGPDGMGRPSAPPTLDVEMTAHDRAVATHRWAHAYQNVSNLGGHSFLNVWDPPIGANQIFSLSQHWYTGGSGAARQTAEVGWQVYPQKYNTTKPVFFIYWTADNYNKTGNYNLDASAFVQTANWWTIGGTLAPSSTYNGAQYEIQVAFYLYKGNWWLYVQGTDAAHAIGYYPTSLYKNGALAAHAATIDYGGEVVGTTSFPGMGSGHFASEGWSKAAYQRDIYYYPTTGGAVYANLTPSQSWPGCYTCQKVNYLPPWNDTIYFGGPGGNC